MKLFKKNNIYRIIRIIGSQNNILSVTSDEKDISDKNVETIEWNFFSIDKGRIPTSKEEILKQVFS